MTLTGKSVCDEQCDVLPGAVNLDVLRLGESGEYAYFHYYNNIITLYVAVTRDLSLRGRRRK